MLLFPLKLPSSRRTSTLEKCHQATASVTAIIFEKCMVMGLSSFSFPTWPTPISLRQRRLLCAESFQQDSSCPGENGHVNTAVSVRPSVEMSF